MRLKTFRAPDLAAALARAHRELGPNAFVLATSEVPGRLGLTGVEITVAADHDDDDAGRELARLAEEVRSLQVRERAVDTAAAGTDKMRRPVERGAAEPTPSRREVGPASGLNPLLREAVDALVGSGLSRDLATRFARIASSDLGEASPAEVVSATERGMAALLPFARTPLQAKVLFVVGPPGAGKTTTAAKLAARLRWGAGRPVIFAEADGERVGALEQARIYSEHIGARLTPVADVDDLARALRQRGKTGCVVVDTAGLSADDEQRLDVLARLRRRTPDAEVVLVIPAGMHRDEVRRVVERFRPLRPTCAAISRVDDGGRLGDLVTALAAAELPLAFVTNGHRIPDDLQEASPRGLAALMLRSGIDTVGGKAKQEIL